MEAEGTSALWDLPPGTRRFHWEDLAVVGLIVILVTAVFFQVRDFGFLTFDDPVYVSRNPHIANGLTLAGIKWAFTNNATGNWHPLVWLSYMLEVEVFGVNPGVHHLVNAMLHLANSILCYVVLRAMTGDRWPSAVVAVLFAIHPLHVESVAWISERKDGLSALFGFLAIGAYLRYVKAPSALRYAAVAISFALGLLSKAMLVTLPVVLLLLDDWPLHRTPTEPLGSEASWKAVVSLFREKGVLFALSAASAVITWWFQSWQGATTSLEALPFLLRLQNALDSLLRYLVAMAWPSGLAVYYPHPGSSLPAWRPVLAAVLLGSATAAVLSLGRRHRYLVTGWFWYLVTLLPVIGLVQVGSQARADRYTYIPLIGIFIMLAWGGRELARRRGLPAWFGRSLAALLTGVLACLAFRQVRHWRDDASLFGHAVEVGQDSAVAREHLGHAYLAQGRAREAAVEYRRGLALKPQSLELNYGMGDALSRLGDQAGAIGYFQRVRALHPDYPLADYRIAEELLRWGRPLEAVPYYRRVMLARPQELDPDPARGREISIACGGRAGLILRAAHRPQEARDCFEFIQRMDPDRTATNLFLGMTLLDLGKAADAVPFLQKAIAHQPGSSEAHYRLGIALAAIGRIEEARDSLDTAIRLDPRHTEAVKLRNTLRMRSTALEAQGRP